MAVQGGTVKVAISTDFLTSFSHIPKQQQKKVRDFVEKFRGNPTAASINYEKINVKDKNLRSIRIDQAYRGIVLAPESGNVYMLLWVDHHDKAYQWAENKVFSIHPTTGSLQVVDTRDKEIVENELKEETAAKGLLDGVKDKHLVQLGIPEVLLPLIRNITTEEELDKIEKVLPQEAYEALFMLAAGYKLEEVYAELEKKGGPAEVDTSDFESALDKDDSQRRFHVVQDAFELAEMLNAPLEQWRVFLHPSQRKLVKMNAKGPVRVLGGAGTGKTVVAMHRAKWLAQEIFKGENDRVLFTTFTKNLAADIQENLRKICPVSMLKRIEVINLDAWVSQFLKKHGYEYKVVFDADIASQWENALNVAPSDLDLDKSFYRDEWESVIQAQGISTGEEYLKASRIGRGRRLNRVERKKIWDVFEDYRVQLNDRHMKEVVDAIRDARAILEKKGDILPYKAIIVDEAQDMGTEAFKLIRQMIPESRNDASNDVFIVGDAHQRIYKYKVVLSQCGLNIRGRSRKLRINYRTTEETRRWAVRLLEGVKIDDLDGSLDTQKGYKSLLHGTPPQIKHFKSFDEEVKHIVAYLNELQTETVPLSSICLVVRTNNMLKQYEAALKSNDLPTYLIKRSVSEDRSAKGLRLATMHRVKGLEFDYLIIASVNEGVVPLNYAMAQQDNFIAEEESETRERALLYVSATRAKKQVLVTSFGKKSRFL